MFYQICRNTPLCRAEFYQDDIFIASQAQLLPRRIPASAHSAARVEDIEIVKTCKFSRHSNGNAAPARQSRLSRDWGEGCAGAEQVVKDSGTVKIHPAVN